MLIRLLGFSLLVPLCFAFLAEERRLSSGRVAALADTVRFIERMERGVSVGMLTFDKIVTDALSESPQWLKEVLGNEGFGCNTVGACMLSDEEGRALTEFLNAFGSSGRESEIKNARRAMQYFADAQRRAAEKQQRNAKVYPLLVFAALAGTFILII